MNTLSYKGDVMAAYLRNFVESPQLWGVLALIVSYTQEEIETVLRILVLVATLVYTLIQIYYKIKNRRKDKRHG